MRKGLKKKHKNTNELHAYHADIITRQRILRLLKNQDDLQVLSVVLNKAKVYIDLKNQKNYLYTYTANILLDCLYATKSITTSEAIKICIDRKDTKKSIRDNFIAHLQKSLDNKGICLR